MAKAQVYEGKVDADFGGAGRGDGNVDSDSGGGWWGSCGARSAMGRGLGLRDQFGGGGGTELMDGEPGLLVGIERVEGGGAGIAEGVEVVDERDAAVLEGELGDGEDVFGLVEVVLAVAVGEALGLNVADPGLIDVGDDLVAGGGFGEAGGVGLEAGGVLVALVAIEDADGDVDGEAGRVARFRCGRTRLRGWGRRCRWRWRGGSWRRLQRRRSGLRRSRGGW